MGIFPGAGRFLAQNEASWTQQQKPPSLDRHLVLTRFHHASTLTPHASHLQPIARRLRSINGSQRVVCRALCSPLDRALLHAPPVADGYNSFIGSLRTKTNLSPDLLELSICRIGVLNKAIYEWNIHGPLALKAGVSVNELSDVAALPTFTDEEQSRKAWAHSVLTRTQKAVIKYTDEMTVRVAVSDEVFQELHEVLPSDRSIVELTATVAGYNCVSRFLVALDVGEHNDGEMKSPQHMVENA
ncbi:hypothetical protein N7468_002225 [Penicillium chermesinum]|uniref:Carboxymuconolactone decarboxylase-like domain-containing protein n=1 Tax=Penicillium chermesinum TaxID=63820 RepID=A0A9W9PL08_9EURO|nr:uncharacterized protein N7468_002225 [Penicillium chermesinum]KAJ5247242.1 hypothetical protein N7468_002225 [Penicillium chermesinum]